MGMHKPISQRWDSFNLLRPFAPTSDCRAGWTSAPSCSIVLQSHFNWLHSWEMTSLHVADTGVYLKPSQAQIAGGFRTRGWNTETNKGSDLLCHRWHSNHGAVHAMGISAFGRRLHTAELGGVARYHTTSINCSSWDHTMEGLSRLPDVCGLIVIIILTRPWTQMWTCTTPKNKSQIFVKDEVPVAKFECDI